MIESHHLCAVIATSTEVRSYTADQFAELLDSSARAAGLSPVGKIAVDLHPQGSSAVVLLTESHVVIHHWPEFEKVTVDVHVCDFGADNAARARTLADILEQSLSRPDVRAVWETHHISG